MENLTFRDHACGLDATGEGHCDCVWFQQTSKRMAVGIGEGIVLAFTLLTITALVIII